MSQARGPRGPLPLPVYRAWSPRRAQARHPVTHTLREETHRAGRPFPSVTVFHLLSLAPYGASHCSSGTLSLSALFSIDKALRSAIGVPRSLSAPSSAF